MLILFALGIAILWGLIKWIAVIVEVMRDRCWDDGYKRGAIISNVFYLVISVAVLILSASFTAFFMCYFILAWLGNTVFCLCTTSTPNATKMHDEPKNDDYGYIERK